ncbi:MAG TPA: DEAD/DEAH box helicase [Chitinophagales bacterium]|nr:DEAD/DEAH box helicase [Chitinophagales bacterium]HRG86605.1 DEAD/DEAH box helicase [Chitinophagales bacterium]
MDFTTFGFEQELMEGMMSMGFKAPTPIQEQAIPIILSNKDIIACAQTGTGKTAAYLLPVINKIIKRGHGSINTLIIVPTRELAVQIDEAIRAFTYFTNLSSIAVYGGNDGVMYEQEKRSFREGVDIIVGTPGRLLSHISQGYLKFDTLQHLILDEADRMLDMGFSDDISRIISYLPENRQSLLFSATMPGKIRAIAKKILKDPDQINIALSKPAEGVTQGVYILHDAQKMPLLRIILNGRDIKSILIFSSTKEKVKQLEMELKRLKYNVSAIHSDLEQIQRKAVLRSFSNRELQILVATDILSRGIDIDNIGLVINYDVPGDAEDYIHRVGRTARADTKGEAITLVGPNDQRKLMQIEELIEGEINRLQVPEELGEVPAYEPKLRRNSGNFNRGGKKTFHRRSGPRR